MRNDLEALAQIVGRVPVFYRIATDLVIASNPAARRDGLPYCCRVANLDLYGTVVALNMNGDHYLPLKAAVVPLAMRLLGGTQNERSKN